MTNQPRPKMGKTAQGEPMHYSVGAVIERDGTYLLLERAQFPPGFAGAAGHVDVDEEPDDALAREVVEETGLRVISQNLLFSEVAPDNPCGYGVTTHTWWVYAVEVTGEPDVDAHEAKSWGWFTPEAIATLPLEDVWLRWFQKLEIIS